MRKALRLLVVSWVFVFVSHSVWAINYIKAEGVGPVGHEHVVFGNAEFGLAYQVEATVEPLAAMATASSSMASVSGTTLGQLWRLPALPKYTTFQPMVNDEAYYRDAFTALTYTAVATHDGQAWTVKKKIVASDGTVSESSWPDLKYYAELGGVQSCFYAPGWAYYICGLDSITITAYTQSQCNPYGTWTFSVYEDGGFVGERSFKMLGEVPPDDLTILSQSNNAHSYDSICYKIVNGVKQSAGCGEYGAIPYTIGQKGCALTSSAMVLNYHGIQAFPGPLDEYLLSLGQLGYTSTGKVVWTGPARYSGSVVRSLGAASANDVLLKDRICRYGPQVRLSRVQDTLLWLLVEPATTQPGRYTILRAAL